MKTVIFKKYPIKSLANKNMEIEQLIEMEFFSRFIYKIQNQFFQDVNTFLKYYSQYFPSNTINFMFQHEIRPISIYEFSKCIFNSYLIIDNKFYPIRPIIQDFTNLKGIPDITYLTNNDKIEEFNKILQNRSNTPIFPHQEALNDKGVCFDNLNMLDKALDVLNKILRINPNNILAIYNKGAIFIKLKKFDDTIEIINKLLEIDCKSPLAYYLRACLKSVQNDIHNASIDLRLALNLNKNLLNNAESEPDLKNLRDSNEFKKILNDFE